MGGNDPVISQSQYQIYWSFGNLRRKNPDRKVHGANMGPIWGRQDPGGPMLALWTLLSGNISNSIIYLVLPDYFNLNARYRSLTYKISLEYYMDIEHYSNNNKFNKLLK